MVLSLLISVTIAAAQMRLPLRAMILWGLVLAWIALELASIVINSRDDGGEPQKYVEGGQEWNVHPTETSYITNCNGYPHTECREWDESGKVRASPKAICL